MRKHGSARKVTARVVAVGHDCDVAMLTVDDDEFWEGLFSEKCLHLGNADSTTAPALQDHVTVVGYPTGSVPNAENTSHSKRSTALSSRNLELSFGFVMKPSLLRQCIERRTSKLPKL